MTKEFPWNQGGEQSVVPVLAALVLFLISFVAGCSPPGGPAPTPTPTLSPTATITPTPTIVWFPPTDTPTMVPTVFIPPTPDVRPGLGEVLLMDDFRGSEKWLLTNGSRGSTNIAQEELTVALVESGAYLSSVREEPLLRDFYAEITAHTSLCSGFDEYGMLVRVASPADFYRFSLSCNGHVRLDRISGGVASSPQPWVFSSAVPSAAPSTVRLGVWAVGKEMRFFVDGFHQFTVTDPLFPNGALGVFARSAEEKAVTVSFRKLVVREVESVP